MDNSVKVIIVDDHPFFRQGVRFFLDSMYEFKLIGEAENGEQALEIIAGHEADIVLMDLQMPGMDGISATEALLEKDPALRILILTSYGNDDKIQKAIAAGASGYCLKDAPPEELATAIRAVAAGGTYLGRGITPTVLTRNPVKNEGKDVTDDGGSGNIDELFAELTQRELEVLDKLAEGYGNKEIAKELIVSEKTVKTHVANILSKLGVKTRTQAALLASRHLPKRRAADD